MPAKASAAIRKSAAPLRSRREGLRRCRYCRAVTVVYHGSGRSIVYRQFCKGDYVGRSPTSTRRSGPIRNLPGPTATAAKPTKAKNIRIMRLPTSAKRRGSIHRFPTRSGVSTACRRCWPRDPILKDFGDKVAEADLSCDLLRRPRRRDQRRELSCSVDAELARADHVEDEAVTLKRVKAQAAYRLRNRMQRFERLLDLLPRGHVFDGGLVVLR
jgi:hypothetical protein